MDRRSSIMAIGMTVLPWRAALGAPDRVVRVGVMLRDPESWAAAQVLAQVYLRAGLKSRPVPMPAARAAIAVVMGDVDADLMRIAEFGTMHPQLVRVPTPLYRLYAVAASLNARHVEVHTREDLARYTIGAVRGYFYVQELTAGHGAVSLTQSTEQLCRMLRAERVDLALDTTVSLRYMLNRLGMDQTTISPPLATLELYHYLHPREAALAEPIDEVLRSMTARGELARLAHQFEAQAVTMAPEEFFQADTSGPSPPPSIPSP